MQSLYLQANRERVWIFEYCLWTHNNSKTMAHCGHMVLVELMTLIFVLYCEEVTGVDVRANPSTITIGGQNSENSRLTISCTPNTPGITSVLALEIGKKTQFNTNSPIAQLAAGNPNVDIRDTSLQQRMTQTGSINGASGNLEIVLSDLRCTDAASYYCTLSYLAGGIGNDEGIVNVTARTFPEEVTMFPSPDFSQYDSNTELDLTCNGSIGNQFDQSNMANVWVWEWRFADGFNSQWTTYPNTNNNITFDPPTTAANCQYNARSVLKHVVKSTDNGRQFRCYVVSPEYGGNKTVYLETPPVTDSPCGVVDCTEGRCPTPEDFYCTKHSQSSVTLQWVFNGTKCSSFKFDFKFRHDEESTWNAVDTSQQDRQLEIMHDVQITQLKSNSLYFFRLSVDGNQAGQRETFTTTCFTQQAKEDPPTNLSSPRNRVDAGFVLMLLVGGLCLQQI